MFECVVKKLVVKRLNKLLKEYDGDIEKVKRSIRLWLKRVNLVAKCLDSLLDKLDDGEITPDEVKETIEDFTEMIKDL